MSRFGVHTCLFWAYRKLENASFFIFIQHSAVYNKILSESEVKDFFLENHFIELRRKIDV